MFTLTLLAVACLAQTDPIGEKVDKERAAYHDDRGEVIAELLKSLAKKEKDERERRNPRQAVLEAVELDREHLSERGWLPEWSDRRLKTKVAKARDSLKRTLSRAYSDYVKQKQDASATRANRELAWLDNEPTIVPALDRRWKWEGGSSFSMLTDVHWQETNANGHVFRFMEHGRNEEFIELVDASRNIPSGGARVRLFDQQVLIWTTASMDHKPDYAHDGQWIKIGKPAGVLGYKDNRRIWKHEGGSFRKGANGWEELDPHGDTFSKFQEVARTWEGVDLVDKSRFGPGGVLVKLRDGRADIWFDSHDGPPKITYVGGWQP